MTILISNFAGLEEAGSETITFERLTSGKREKRWPQNRLRYTNWSITMLHHWVTASPLADELIQSVKLMHIIARRTSWTPREKSSVKCITTYQMTTNVPCAPTEGWTPSGWEASRLFGTLGLGFPITWDKTAIVRTWLNPFNALHLLPDVS